MLQGSQWHFNSLGLWQVVYVLNGPKLWADTLEWTTPWTKQQGSALHTSTGLGDADFLGKEMCFGVFEWEIAVKFKM